MMLGGDFDETRDPLIYTRSRLSRKDIVFCFFSSRFQPRGSSERRAFRVPKCKSRLWANFQRV